MIEIPKLLHSVLKLLKHLLKSANDTNTSLMYEYSTLKLISSNL